MCFNSYAKRAQADSWQEIKNQEINQRKKWFRVIIPGFIEKYLFRLLLCIVRDKQFRRTKTGALELSKLLGPWRAVVRQEKY